MEPAVSIRSPCNSICAIDPATKLCTGCLRTLEEIASWSQLPVARKAALLQVLAERRARASSDFAVTAQGDSVGER